MGTWRGKELPDGLIEQLTNDQGRKDELIEPVAECLSKDAMTLDDVLIAVYEKTKKVYSRQRVAGRLKRLVEHGRAKRDGKAKSATYKAV